MYRLPLSRLSLQIHGGRRLYSSHFSESQILNLAAVDEWISSPKQLVLNDTLHPERLSDLYITLPTRDGLRKPYYEPHPSAKLGYGHHLAFFHPRTPEPLLRSDGTEGDFCPPDPYTRRMWAGGTMYWDMKNPLLIGEKATSTSTISSVEKKGFDKGNPMLFVNQKIEYTMVGKETPSVVEDRVHVYLPEAAGRDKAPKEVKEIPTTHEFSFKYTPTITTLFRFSALTFNAHHIHLDKDYAQFSEGYPERLVHGPLTALMLLETVVDQNPGVKIKHFEYQARNPLIVGQALAIHGHWKDRQTAKVWCVNEEGVVGMTGVVVVEGRKVTVE